MLTTAILYREFRRPCRDLTHFPIFEFEEEVLDNYVVDEAHPGLAGGDAECIRRPRGTWENAFGP